MQRGFIKIVIILILAGALGWLFYFYWHNLRGAWPAFSPPQQNIGKLLREANNLSKQNKWRTRKEQKLMTEDQYIEQGPLLLPVGFSIDTYAENLGKPRVLALSPEEVLLVSIPAAGKVVALPDRNKDGQADEVIDVVSGLNKPHGLVFYCQQQECQLFIAETDRVSVYDYDRQKNKASNPRKIIDLPAGGRHWTRTIMIAEIDGSPRLLISVGSSCDTCFEQDWRRAKILQADLDGSNLREFARGLRNSVFMTKHPLKGEIWATEMGRDYLGDELPPDEINIIKEGKDYGWPICYGKRVHDIKFDKREYIQDPCLSTEPSYIDIPAHSSPLGLGFVPLDSGWPDYLQGDLLVAYHGSWNRTVPRGYKIRRFKLDEGGNVLGESDFISGWLQRGDALGRPVDILLLPQGVMYISDDKAGVIYRVIYQG